MNLKERLQLFVRQILTGASTNTSMNCGAAEIHFPLALSEWWVTGEEFCSPAVFQPHHSPSLWEAVLEIAALVL